LARFRRFARFRVEALQQVRCVVARVVTIRFSSSSLASLYEAGHPLELVLLLRHEPLYLAAAAAAVRSRFDRLPARVQLLFQPVDGA
jgi:hypothetical protein